ncbi:MAG: hypothetical protein PHE51_01780, partial [Eubacteriales bacterium]|nr:hypothetical protein [Eubacteriales bacterium]
GGIWTYLGTYKMNSGTDGYVKLLADGVGQTSADAVKFVAINAQGKSPFVYINMENTAQVVNTDIIDGYITAVNIQNAQSAGATADFIVALYKDNMLVSIKIFNGIQTAEKIILTEPIKYIDGCTIKPLLWNIKNLQPLAVN